MVVRRLAHVVLLFALPLAAVACGGNDNGSVKLPGGGQVQVSPSGGGITVEGPSGGQVNIGTGDYPEGWPSDFPVPDGATPVYSIGAAGSSSVWFSTDQTTDEVKSFFESALPSAGYTIDSTADFSDANGDYTVMSISGNGMSGGVYMGAGAAAAAGAGFGGDFDFFVTLSSS